MGIWDAISKGEMPSMDDVAETGTSAYEGAAGAVKATGSGLADAGNYVADGAAGLASSAYHGLTDWHFEGRDGLNNVGDPSSQPTNEELSGGTNGWRRLPDSQSVLHQDDSRAGKEAKFVNEDGRESVRYVDGDGNLQDEVTRDDIRGTYNYVNPGDWEKDNIAEYGLGMAGHFFADVLPWMIGGSVRGDG